MSDPTEPVSTPATSAGCEPFDLTDSYAYCDLLLEMPAHLRSAQHKHDLAAAREGLGMMFFFKDHPDYEDFAQRSGDRLIAITIGAVLLEAHSIREKNRSYLAKCTSLQNQKMVLPAPEAT